tara:strand:- start:442 stop:735 length:294 start_codon:yes stop_codon:yes gene_type:complete
MAKLKSAQSSRPRNNAELISKYERGKLRPKRNDGKMEGHQRHQISKLAAYNKQRARGNPKNVPTKVRGQSKPRMTSAMTQDKIKKAGRTLSKIKWKR